MRYFRFADVDDRCQSGLTLFWWREQRRSWRFDWRLCLRRLSDHGRVRWGFSRQSRVKRGFGIRVVIEVPLPITREFYVDYHSHRQECRANAWLCIELIRWFRPFAACAIRAGTPKGPRIALMKRRAS